MVKKRKSEVKDTSTWKLVGLVIVVALVTLAVLDSRKVNLSPEDDVVMLGRDDWVSVQDDIQRLEDEVMRLEEELVVLTGGEEISDPLMEGYVDPDNPDATVGAGACTDGPVETWASGGSMEDAKDVCKSQLKLECKNLCEPQKCKDKLLSDPPVEYVPVNDGPFYFKVTCNAECDCYL